jgi:glycosyltransferase involved in cell wall biosynthesis|tara:strand:+ start:11350 stop:13017 length:1668 start_codon:yes stop_codon:yes gene_type:complete
MRKKKILFVSEASWKVTGYSVYTKEVLSRLSQIQNLEVAELACYACSTDTEVQTTPWKVYPNKPHPSSPEFQEYKGTPTRVFGEQTFNGVLLDFQPDIVMDIRDWWMFEYQQRSPFRDLFHWAIMPTVDAAPQHPQWMNTFQSADSVLAYSEFGRDVMLEQCDNLNFVDVASPAASEAFYPVEDKIAHKESMGLNGDSLIVGTVMRNQRRKLYPDLFKSFRQLLDETKNPNLFLLCHQYYPDIGWETPALLNRFGLNNRALFSYKCADCGVLQVDFFQDSVGYCGQCKKLKRQMVGLDNPVTEDELNAIYNLFDVYVQYANSEGFGMPQLEAAYAGVPVVSTYYSAMESVVDNIGGLGINPLAYSMECETGCYRAVPNNDKFVEVLKELLTISGTTDKHAVAQKLRNRGLEISTRARAYYSWDKTADIWANRIASIPMRDPKETWLSPPQIHEAAKHVPDNIRDLADKVDFIFTDILHKPQWIGGYLWAKILRDCTFKYRILNKDNDFYFNESHLPSMDQYQPFSFEQACQEMTFFRNQINEWETLRGDLRGQPA